LPSISENHVRWTEHSWRGEGEEWSPGGTRAGGEMFWWRGLLPRLHTHLPASRVLEIGPGFGRWTSHLESYVDQLLLVDLTDRCIEHCRRRFSHRSHIEYWTNDGQSLDMVEDESLDFVFSFDSLVHAEAAVLRGYLAQLGRKLKPGGTGFIHHSNLAALAAPDGTCAVWARKNWRGETRSAGLVRDGCWGGGVGGASGGLR
jgi:ubiquinone/menaquinone biosynthesis C-methylase UbiE